ncbi:MAG TPA: radical SAM protein [Desulfobulbus sp.]|nr:radical SAM protein [Desulfobulbus sp.]
MNRGEVVLTTSAPPKYGLIQIEPTSRCNLRCRTCLRASNPEQWRERDLPFSLFQQLSTEFKQADTIHLQGWGEPLVLDPFSRYLETVKKSGCRVSFTTNGQIMDRDLAVSLIRSGVDAITFSMAGATAEVQDSLRGPGSFARLQSSISTLTTAKKELDSKSPVLAVSYLLTPTTVEELPGAVGWCGKHGISLLAGVHLTHAANEEQQNLQLFPTNDRRIKNLVRKAHVRALFAGIRLELPSFQPTMAPVCAKDPVHNLSIAADGSVAPCVFLNAPVSPSVQWLENNQVIGNTLFIFGNIKTERLMDIWNKPAYREFRYCFLKRQRLYQQALARVGYDMNGIEQLERAKRKIKRDFIDNPVPSPCRQCPKLCGY